MFPPTPIPVFQAFFAGNIPPEENPSQAVSASNGFNALHPTYFGSMPAYYNNPDSYPTTTVEDKNEKIANELCSQLGIRRTPSPKQEKKSELQFTFNVDAQVVGTVAVEPSRPLMTFFNEGPSVVAYSTTDEKDGKPVYCVLPRNANQPTFTSINGINYLLSADIRNANSTTAYPGYVKDYSGQTYI